MAIEDYGSRVAADARGLDDLKAKAKSDPRGALKGATKHIEAYFMQTKLQSMRDTLSQDSMVDSEQTRFYTSMFDQQLGQNLADTGSLGLARMLESQLARAQFGAMPESSAAGLPGKLPVDGTSLPVGADFSAQRLLSPAVERALREAQEKANAVNLQKNSANATLPVASPSMAAPVSATSAAATPRDFVAAVWPHAVEASEVTGLPPHLTVAHAALESGWGKSEPLRTDGTPSYNVFGIKAGKRWTGDTVEAVTTEYENGQAKTKVEKFRAYGSYREAFLDYANLLAASPRFASVLSSGSGTDFANSLQQSGYATDPMYAAKLSRIIQGKTLRDALQG